MTLTLLQRYLHSSSSPPDFNTLFSQIEPTISLLFSSKPVPSSQWISVFPTVHEIHVHFPEALDLVTEKLQSKYLYEYEEKSLKKLNQAQSSDKKKFLASFGKIYKQHNQCWSWTGKNQKLSMALVHDHLSLVSSILNSTQRQLTIPGEHQMEIFRLFEVKIQCEKVKVQWIVCEKP